MKNIFKVFVSIVVIVFAASPGRVFAEDSTDYAKPPFALEAKDVLP